MTRVCVRVFRCIKVEKNKIISHFVNLVLFSGTLDMQSQWPAGCMGSRSDSWSKIPNPHKTKKFLLLNPGQGSSTAQGQVCRGLGSGE